MHVVGMKKSKYYVHSKVVESSPVDDFMKISDPRATIKTRREEREVLDATRKRVS